MPVINVEKLIKDRVNAIRTYHESTGIKKAELDVSGGIDSAVMLMLLSKAVGPENVTTVYSSINSSETSLKRARVAAEAANVKLVELDLTKAFYEITEHCIEQAVEAGYSGDEIKDLMEKDPTIMGSFRSCLRAPVGRFMNRMAGGGIRHGTGNEDEDRWLRFYQKGGDGEVDTNPLAMLSKGEVYQLAVGLGVPKEIIEALPTPDLWGSGDIHNDEDELSKISGVEWTYSRVNSETGEYTRIGTIEKMSRFIDKYGWTFYSGIDGGRGFFERGEENRYLAPIELSVAKRFGLTEKHLRSALRWEKITRHKENPNCPTLGKRNYLIEDDIITNELPEEL